ncbi:MAG: hypothetical protein M1833_001785 [Piccolia ochrophora]|nr:MAG: hypothetical protein M1833_001785 [Piccolia ochrophora]
MKVFSREVGLVGLFASSAAARALSARQIAGPEVAKPNFDQSCDLVAQESLTQTLGLTKTLLDSARNFHNAEAWELIFPQCDGAAVAKVYEKVINAAVPLFYCDPEKKEHLCQDGVVGNNTQPTYIYPVPNIEGNLATGLHLQVCPRLFELQQSVECNGVGKKADGGGEYKLQELVQDQASTLLYALVEGQGDTLEGVPDDVNQFIVWPDLEWNPEETLKKSKDNKERPNEAKAPFEKIPTNGLAQVNVYSYVMYAEAMFGAQKCFAPAA